MKLFLIAFLLFQGSFGGLPPNDEPIKDYAGQYVLVHRYWGGCTVSSGDLVSWTNCWHYEQEYFPTLDAAEKKLQDSCGSGYSCITPTNFVGIYRLTPAISRADATFTEGDKEIPQHVESRKEHWSKWTVKK